MTHFVLALTTAALLAAGESPLPAFPGAEGAGAYTPGGRGGKVYAVTTLEDYNPRREDPIPGSLRAACMAKGPRIIVFHVGGVIDLKARLDLREPRVTIAGQTAPGGGICLKRYALQISTEDAVVRHLRVRPGDEEEIAQDAISITGAKNAIVDHCSASWSNDETVSVSGAGQSNITVQWCIISESLDQSHHEKGAHGYGSLLRTDGDVTFHHNLYAHHRTRCPRPGTYGEEPGILLDFRNNAVYNWITFAGYSAADPVRMNYVGNWLKPGPSSENRAFAFSVGGDKTTVYAADNWLVGAGEAVESPWALFKNADQATRLDAPLPTTPVTTQPPQEAAEAVLAGAGATLPARDAVDVRVVEEVRNGKGQIINSQEEVGGWPDYAPGAPHVDSDGDGIPDPWETAHGLNPKDPSDAQADSDGDGYANIQEWCFAP